MPARKARGVEARRGGAGGLSAARPALALLLAALAACGAEPEASAPHAPGEGARAAAGAEGVSVRLFEVGAPAAPQPVRAAGTVRIRRETPLAFWTAGVVARLDPREGDRVARGTLLAALDTRTLDAEVAAAGADLARARAERERMRALLAQGWVPRARVEAAEAAEGVAAAALERARFARRNATIVAPAEGIILARRAEPGQTVAAGEPVLVLGERRSGFVMQVALAPAEAAGLAVGTPVSITFADGVAPAMAGRILEIGGRADPRTGTFRIEVSLPDHPALRSGQLGEVEIPRPAAASARAPLVVPATALFAARAGEGFVWRLDPASGTVRATLVRVGAVTADGVVIEAGLAPGDRIVLTGVDRLTEGARVRVSAGPRA